jgi:hypothetical protein
MTVGTHALYVITYACLLVPGQILRLRVNAFARLSGPAS